MFYKVILMQTCNKWQSAQAALGEIVGCLRNFTAYITINQMVITYIHNSGVPRKGKMNKELISTFINYGFKMENCSLVYFQQFFFSLVSSITGELNLLPL